MSDEASEANPDDGDEAYGQCSEDQSLENAGRPEGHLEVIAGKDSLTDFETDHRSRQGHRESERGGDRGFGCQYLASIGRGGKGGPDHARRIFGCHRPYSERPKQYSADQEKSPQRAGRRDRTHSAAKRSW